MTVPLNNENPDAANHNADTHSTGNLIAGSLTRDFVLALRQLRRECRLSEYLVLIFALVLSVACLLYTSPSPRDATLSRMPSSA